jgi:hypothetical protein
MTIDYPQFGKHQIFRLLALKGQNILTHGEAMWHQLNSLKLALKGRHNNFALSGLIAEVSF